MTVEEAVRLAAAALVPVPVREVLYEAERSMLDARWAWLALQSSVQDGCITRADIASADAAYTEASEHLDRIRALVSECYPVDDAVDSAEQNDFDGRA